ncbi:MAG: outer membrane protein OmpA-like peptidoglycan-associated protein [Maribacter sp.]|jgi:outer membrane protein OmpA-like peptidoglycan-associated protein
MKRIILGIAITLLFLGTKLNGQNYRVQVATYEQGVGMDYFTDSGLSNITQEIDVNGFYRYYTRGTYTTQSEAIQAQEEVVSSGFKHAQVIDLKRLKEECSSPCAMQPSFTSGMVLEIIFFDFDKDVLRSKSKTDLDALHQVLVENPAYEVDFVAHTDSKGTNDYNVNLSNRRGERAKKYLVNKGISAARIGTQVKGETTPIAKNTTMEGKDLPEGRQYNRRVEFVLRNVDSMTASQIIEAVQIPEHLKANN